MAGTVGAHPSKLSQKSLRDANRGIPRSARDSACCNKSPLTPLFLRGGTGSYPPLAKGGRGDFHSNPLYHGTIHFAPTVLRHFPCGCPGQARGPPLQRGKYVTELMTRAKHHPTANGPPCCNSSLTRSGRLLRFHREHHVHSHMWSRRRQLVGRIAAARTAIIVFVSSSSKPSRPAGPKRLLRQVPTSRE